MGSEASGASLTGQGVCSNCFTLVVVAQAADEQMTRFLQSPEKKGATADVASLKDLPHVVLEQIATMLIWRPQLQAFAGSARFIKQVVRCSRMVEFVLDGFFPGDRMYDVRRWHGSTIPQRDSKCSACVGISSGSSVY